LLILLAALGWLYVRKQRWGRLFGNADSIASLEQTGIGNHVRVRGVVTYYDFGAQLLYLQDSTAAVTIRSLERDWNLRAGDRVEVQGYAAADRGSVVWPENKTITNVSVKVLGRAVLPSPIPASLGGFPKNGKASARVSFRGVVHTTRWSGGRLLLRVSASPTQEGERWDAPVADLPVPVTVKDARGAIPEALVDAEVEVLGVVEQPRVSSVAYIETARLLAESMADVVIEQPAPRNPIEVPSLRALFVSDTLDPMRHRVRVRGTVVLRDLEKQILLIADEVGTLPVETEDKTEVKAGDQVEVTGFPRNKEYTRLPTALHLVVLQDGTYQRVTPQEAGKNRSEAQAEEQGGFPVLTRVAAIRALTAEQASRCYPVRLEGVVTLQERDPMWHYFFFQDATAGIYVDAIDQPEVLRVGQKVRVVGVTGPGAFAPIVTQPHMEVLGMGRLPTPLRPTLAEAISGALDSQWVELEGVVHPMKEDIAGHVMFDLYSNVGNVNVRVSSGTNPGDLEKLTDAQVRVRGVMGTAFNLRRQLTRLILFVTGPGDFRVLRVGSADPFSVQGRAPIKDLLQFSPEGSASHRQGVRGVLTLRRPGGEVYLEDGTGGLQVYTNDLSTQPGDLVDAVGYVVPGELSPVLNDAALRKVGVKALPLGPLLTAEQMLRGEYNNRRVAIEAELLDRVVNSREQILVLRSNRFTFNAQLDTEKSVPEFDALRNGSTLRLTGVCTVQAEPVFISVNNQRVPQSFRIYLCLPGDVAVVRGAPWWTLKHALGVVGLMALVVATALAWVAVLRRRVQAQTAELKRAKEAAEGAKEVAESAERRSRAIIEHSPYGIASVEVNGGLLEANPAFRQIAGIGPEEKLSELTLKDVLKFSEEGEEEFARALEAGGTFHHLELSCSRRDTSRVALRVSGRIVRRTAKGRDTVELITEDITAQRQLEQQFLQAQKMEAVGRLAGGVAHDFNNLLNVIGGSVELLSMSAGGEGRIRPYTDKIAAAVRRAAALTTQLLAFSRKQALMPKVVDLNAVLTEIGKMLPRIIGEDIDLTVYASPSPVLIRVDEGQIEQVVLNLVVNARDAMPKGGALTIDCHKVQLTSDYARRHAGIEPGEYVMLAVTDTGMGMDRATQSRIFEPFFTTKERGKGTGLGLSTVYGIVKQCGGYIWVYSEPGKGTTFKVYLPVAQEVIAGPEKQAAHPLQVEGNETLLFVEDEASLLEATCDYFQRLGYMVLRAKGGPEALDVAARHPGAIHVLVTDVILPKMSGRELAETLKGLRPGMQVIYVSGYTDNALADRGLMGPEVKFVQKPYSLVGLATQIRESLTVRMT
jgi:PAS domain S-box-containing protein